MKRPLQDAIRKAVVALLRERADRAAPTIEELRIAAAAVLDAKLCGSDLRRAVQALRFAGKLHWERLELSPSMLLEPSADEQEPIDEEPVDPERLLAEIDGFCSEVGMGRARFGVMAGQSATWVSNALAHARRPVTPDRARACRALIARGVEAAKSDLSRSMELRVMISRAERERRGMPLSPRMERDNSGLAAAEARKAEIERNREETRRAHDERVARIREVTEQETATRSERRTEARRLTTAHPLAREREEEEIGSPSALLRRIEREWPGYRERAKALAEGEGLRISEVWERVIGAGLRSVEEEAA